MILCNDCGEQNAEGTVFCGRCGVFLEWEGEQLKTTAGATAANGLAGGGVAGNGPAGSGVGGKGLAGNGLVGNGPAGNGLAGSGVAGSGPGSRESGFSNAAGIIRPGPDARRPAPEVIPEPATRELAPLPAPDRQGGVAARQPETVRRRAPRRTNSPVNVPTGSLICGSCGMPNQSTRRFCAKCGFSLVDAKIVQKPAWWRRLLGRERVYAAGTRLRPSAGGRRKVRGFTRLGVVLALLAGGGILAGPQRGLVMRGVHAVQNKVSKPLQVRLVTPTASGFAGQQIARLAFDGATNTFWAAPRAGKGATAVPYLVGSFAGPTKLVAFDIYPGVSKETPKFVAGPRPTEIEVTVTTGSGSPVVKRFPLEDVPGSQRFDLKVNDARTIQIAVVHTKAPSRTLATAITEIEFYAHR